MLLLVVVVVVGDEQDYWMHFSTVREVANESLFRKIESLHSHIFTFSSPTVVRDHNLFVLVRDHK